METSAAVNSAMGVSVMSDISDEENWSYSSSGVTDPMLIEEYNGKIYVYGSAFKVYNPANGTWAELTHSYNDEIVFCNGSFYAYYATWRADGDDYWAAMYGLSKYNISTNTWTTIESDDSGGFFDPAITVCDDRIYFGGGFEVIYDEPVKQDRYDVSYFDTSDYTWHKFNGVVGGGYTVAVLCEDAGAYYNDIFYVDGYCVTRFDTDTNTSTTIGYTDGYFYNPAYSLQHAAVYKNGTIYLAGRTDRESYNINKYNIADNTWSNIDSLVEADAYSMVEYNNKLYTWGSNSNNSIFYINDIVTGSSSYDYFNYAFGDNSVIVSNGKIYAISNDGTLAIYDLSSEQIDIIENDSISSGRNHIVRIIDGEVATYGDNTYGQFGIGDDSSQDKFVISDEPWGNKDIVKVSTKGDTTYAITNDNILYAWGRNDKYQVGDGTNIDKMSPVQIMSDVADVEAGLEHVIVLKTNGDVYGWGSNQHKQVCDNDSTLITEPYKIASQATLIAAGGYHTFYNDSAGTLHGRGFNDSNQVGYPEEVDSPVQVECGSYHTVAIDCNGYMYVWGSNSSNQLCATLPNSAYSTAHPYNTGIIVRSISAGGNFTAFISDKLYVSNTLKYGSDAYQEVTNLSDKMITEMVVGARYSAVVDSNGALWNFGYMADGNYSSNNLYVAPYELKYPYSIKQIDSYRAQTLAVDELGQVIAWGEGYYADGTDKMKIESYPVRIEGINNPKQVSRGKNHNLVLDRNGDVWGWGSNSNYPMGAGLGGKVKTVQKLNNISDVSQIAAGTEFSIFLKNDGTLWGVGKNDRGQLGQGNTTNSSTPVQITAKNGFRKVSVGEIYAIALADDGIYTWGGNTFGQLGNGTTTDNPTPTKIDATLENGEYFTDISAGMDFCMALTNLGNVYAWGDNGSGALGQGNRIDKLVPTKVPNLSNVLTISAGKSGALAIKEDGSVYGWGFAVNNQLGFYHGSGSVLSPTQSTALSQSNIKKITLGYDFSICVDVNGKMYVSGNNEQGQLGIYTVDAKLYSEDTQKTTTTVQGPSDTETTTHAILAEAGEEYVVEFVAQSSGTYTFSTSTNNNNIIVAAYRDSNFTYPYKQINNNGSLEIGVEQGDSVYIRFTNVKSSPYSVTTTITKTSNVVADNKTVYMVLYDSYCGVNDGLWPRYYGTEENEKFQYSEKFFTNYLKLFKDKKVAFAISIRDLDFDCNPVSNADVGKESPSMNLQEIIDNNMKEKTVSGCESYYRRIIHNIVNAYNKLDVSERPNEFPELYLGTPHFNAYAIIGDNNVSNFSEYYLEAVEEIYTKLTTEYSDGLTSINPSLIKGLYFGRENPDIREFEGAERLCLEKVSNFIHNKNKELLWIPFTVGKPENLEKIGALANNGKYTGDDGATHDLFDIVAIQPGLYFYEVNSSTTDAEFTQTLQDLVSCLGHAQNAVYSNGSIVGGSKTTNTKVTVEIEYDNSLITGRKVETNTAVTSSSIVQKVSRFSIVVNNFKTFIYDENTPICIYAGGPNEQNFDNSPGAANNYYRHSNRNHLTLWVNGHMQPYSAFLGNAGNAYDYYNGDVIYDITNGIVNNIWTAKIQAFMGGHLQFNNQNLIIN